MIVRPNETTYYDTDADEQNQNPAPGVKGSSCDGLTNPQGYWKNSGIDPLSAPRVLAIHPGNRGV